MQRMKYPKAFLGRSGTTSSGRYSTELWHRKDLRSLAYLGGKAGAPCNIAHRKCLPAERRSRGTVSLIGASTLVFDDGAESSLAEC